MRREINCGGITWIDLETPTRDEVNDLGKTYSFHHLNLEDCLSKIQITKVEKYGDYLFMILRFPVLCKEGSCSPSQVSFFLGKNYVITVHDAKLGPLNDVYLACQSQMKEGVKFATDGAGSLFYWIFSTIIDSLFPLMESLMDRLEDLEDIVFDAKTEVLIEVTALRRNISDVRRIVSPIRRVALDIAAGVKIISGDDLSIYFNDLHDRIEKIWELSETAREIVEIYKDTDFTLNQQRMNKALVYLTVIFTATIPATIMGTFYGMNIYLPGGLAIEPWTFLGPYTTFIVILSISLVPAAIMLYYFKRMGWL